MSSLLANLAPLVGTYGYVVLFLVSIVEGPIVGIIAGAIAASGAFNIYSVFFTLLAADLVGDILYYLLGRGSAVPSLKKFRTAIGITDERIGPLQKAFNKHNWQLLLFGKTQPWGSVILYIAGLARMPFWEFVGWNAVGTVPKVLLFEFAGYFFGQSIVSSQHYLNYFTFGMLALSIILLGGYWIFERYIGRKFKD